MFFGIVGFVSYFCFYFFVLCDVHQLVVVGMRELEMCDTCDVRYDVVESVQEGPVSFTSTLAGSNELDDEYISS